VLYQAELYPESQFHTNPFLKIRQVSSNDSTTRTESRIFLGNLILFHIEFDSYKNETLSAKLF
jgi:hypothetical protein